jgi:hypothetical protein
MINLLNNSGKNVSVVHISTVIRRNSEMDYNKTIEVPQNTPQKNLLQIPLAHIPLRPLEARADTLVADEANADARAVDKANTIKPGLVSKISQADEVLSSLLRNAVNQP